MTATPEYRFRCDRCGAEETQTMGNSPVHVKIAGPEGWLLLGIGHDPSIPPSHLCNKCAEEFKAFLSRVSPAPT